MGDERKREADDKEAKKREADRRLAEQRETPTPEPGKPATRFG